MFLLWHPWLTTTNLLYVSYSWNFRHRLVRYYWYIWYWLREWRTIFVGYRWIMSWVISYSFILFQAPYKPTSTLEHHEGRCLTIFHMKVIQFCMATPGFVTANRWWCSMAVCPVWYGNPKEGFEGLVRTNQYYSTKTILIPTLLILAGVFFFLSYYLIHELKVFPCVRLSTS